MFGTSSSVNNPQDPNVWPSILPPGTHQLATSVAVLTILYGLTDKSAQKFGELMPNRTITRAFIDACKSAPGIGISLAIQLSIQRTTEKILWNQLKEREESKRIWLSIIGGSSTAALASVPLLTILQSRSQNLPCLPSLSQLTARQVILMTGREMTFLLSLRLSDPLSNAVESALGKNKPMEYACTFVCATTGRLILGHPVDRALALLQKGNKSDLLRQAFRIDNLRQTMRGSGGKALAFGGLACGIKAAMDTIESIYG